MGDYGRARWRIDYPGVFIDGTAYTLDDGYFPRQGFSAHLRYQILRNNYVTAAFNFSRDFYSFRQFETGENLYGFGLGYDYETVVGPVKALVHWSSMTRKVGAYLSLGFDF